MPYSPGCLQGLTLSLNSLMIPAKRLGLRPVCSQGCSCSAGAALAGAAGGMQTLLAAGRDAALLRLFPRLEVRAFPTLQRFPTPSVRHGTAPSHRALSLGLGNCRRFTSLVGFFSFLSRGSRVGSLCWPDCCLGNGLVRLLSKK